jgi:SAM-dependent methyltransferase
MIKETGSVTGSDFSENMIAKAEKRLGSSKNTELTQGDMIENLQKYENNYFDFAGLFWSLEYVNHSRLLKNLYKKMKQNGRISILVNHRLSLMELQDMIAPIIVRNLCCLKKIPPLNFISDIKAFEKAAKRAGFHTDYLEEKSVKVSFVNGKDLVNWMLRGGPSAGFKSSIREKKQEHIFSLIAREVDLRGGLTVTFKYIAYSGIKQ